MFVQPNYNAISDNICLHFYGTKDDRCNGGEGLREAYTKYFNYQYNVTLRVWKVSKQFSYLQASVPSHGHHKGSRHVFTISWIHWRTDMWWQYVLRAKGRQTPTHTESLNLPSTWHVCHTFKAICKRKPTPYSIKADLNIQTLEVKEKQATFPSVTGVLYHDDCPGGAGCQHDSACLMLNPNETFRRCDMSLFTCSVTGRLTEIVRSVIWKVWKTL